MVHSIGIIAQIDDFKKWYAVSTNPRCEDMVYRILSNESYEVFLPKITKIRDKEAMVPLFPGYLFVRFSLSSPDWVKIKYLQGVRKILSFGDNPMPVAEGVIAGIMQRTKSNDCMIEQLSLKAGDKVRFTKGSFEGLEGIFKGEISGKERVKVLLNAICSWAFTVEVSAIELSVAN